MPTPGLASMVSASLLAALLTRPVAADGAAAATAPHPIDGTISVVNDRLTLDANLSTHIARALEPKLGDGLSHRVEIEIVLLSYDPEGRATPFSLTRRDCRLLYDLWAERYAVRVEMNGHRTERWSRTPAAAATICGAITSVLLAPLGKLDLRRRFRVAMRVIIDPRRSRLGAGRPTFGDPLATGGAGRPGGTFFGAMARAFYREEEDRARSTRFESPIFGEALIREALGAAPEAPTLAVPPGPQTQKTSRPSEATEDEEE